MSFVSSSISDEPVVDSSDLLEKCTAQNLPVADVLSDAVPLRSSCFCPSVNIQLQQYESGDAAVETESVGDKRTFDIGLAVDQNLTAAERLSFLENTWVPPDDFEWP